MDGGILWEGYGVGEVGIGRVRGRVILPSFFPWKFYDWKRLTWTCHWWKGAAGMEGLRQPVGSDNSHAHFLCKHACLKSYVLCICTHTFLTTAGTIAVQHNFICPLAPEEQQHNHTKRYIFCPEWIVLSFPSCVRGFCVKLRWQTLCLMQLLFLPLLMQQMLNASCPCDCFLLSCIKKSDFIK